MRKRIAAVVQQLATRGRMVEVSRMGTSINKHTPLKGASTADVYSMNGVMANEFCETVYLA
jgi:hypothetical protein